MTAQDQQSRAEFEAHMRKLSPCVRLYRHTCDGGDKYRTVTVQRSWELWQAARALPAGMEPFGYWHQGPTDDESEFFLHADSGDVSCENCTKLYTAAQVLAMGRVPPGFVAVPVEPTREMCVAGAKACIKHDDEPFHTYAAMLAAAPQPPAAQERKPQAYRLLQDGIDKIKAGDEFLCFDAETWVKDPEGRFAGLPYRSDTFRPGRRPLAAAPRPPAAPATTGPQAATAGAGGVTAGAAQEVLQLRKAAQEALELLEYVKRFPKDAGFIDWQSGVVEQQLRSALDGVPAAHGIKEGGGDAS